MTCRQLANAEIDAAWRRDVLALEIQRERIEVQRVREPGKRPQRLQLRTERKRAVVPRVVQGLDSEMIAREKELAPVAIPEREGEHAGEAIEQRAPPRLPAVDQDLTIAVRCENVPGLLELAPQGPEVVDLAVEHHGDRAVGGDERLMAPCDVDHREPAEAEAHGAVVMKAIVVRATVRERRGHRRQCRARTRVVGPVAGDAAHERRKGDAGPQSYGGCSRAVRDYMS